MSVITFKYSKSLWVFGIIAPSFMTVICVVALNKKNWPELIPIITALVFVISNFCRCCFTHDLRDKIALQLDDEKLTSYIDDRVVYWQDITEIDHMKVRGGLQIILKVNRQDVFEETILISTTHIEGNDLAIYNAIADFANR